jgi:hypothetical protein
MPTERLKITGDRVYTKDASGNLLFDTDYKYVKTSDSGIITANYSSLATGPTVSETSNGVTLTGAYTLGFPRYFWDAFADISGFSFTVPANCYLYYSTPLGFDFNLCRVTINEPAIAYSPIKYIRLNGSIIGTFRYYTVILYKWDGKKFDYYWDERLISIGIAMVEIYPTLGYYIDTTAKRRYYTPPYPVPLYEGSPDYSYYIPESGVVSFDGWDQLGSWPYYQSNCFGCGPPYCGNNPFNPYYVYLYEHQLINGIGTTFFITSPGTTATRSITA